MGSISYAIVDLLRSSRNKNKEAAFVPCNLEMSIVAVHNLYTKMGYERISFEGVPKPKAWTLSGINGFKEE